MCVCVCVCERGSTNLGALLGRHAGKMEGVERHLRDRLAQRLRGDAPDTLAGVAHRPLELRHHLRHKSQLRPGFLMFSPKVAESAVRILERRIPRSLFHRMDCATMHPTLSPGLYIARLNFAITYNI